MAAGTPRDGRGGAEGRRRRRSVAASGPGVVAGRAPAGGAGAASRTRWRAAWTSAANSSAWPRTALRTLSCTAERGARMIWPVYQVLARIGVVAMRVEVDVLDRRRRHVDGARVAVVAQHRDLEVERRHHALAADPQAVAPQLRLGVGLDELARQLQRLGVGRHVVDEDADLLDALERDQPAPRRRRRGRDGSAAADGAATRAATAARDRKGSRSEGEPSGRVRCKRGATAHGGKSHGKSRDNACGGRAVALPKVSRSAETTRAGPPAPGQNGGAGPTTMQGDGTSRLQCPCSPWIPFPSPSATCRSSIASPSRSIPASGSPSSAATAPASRRC